MTPLAPVFAHETWFTHGEHPLDWGFAGETATLALLGGALGVMGLVRLLARRWPGVDVLLVLLVFGSDPRLREAVADWWPWRRSQRPRMSLTSTPEPRRSS